MPGAYTIPATWPTREALNIQLGTSFVERDDWYLGVQQKQHLVYRDTRPILCNLCFDRVTGSSTVTGGYKTQQTVYDAAHFFRIPEAASLWTPDDFDADVEIGVRVRMSVTGFPGNTGTARVTIFGTNVDITRTDAYAMQWTEETGTIAKALTTGGVALNALVSAATSTIEITHLFCYVKPQGTIGV